MPVHPGAPRAQKLDGLGKHLGKARARDSDSWQFATAGLVSGPSILKIERTPSSLLAFAAWRIAP